MYRLLGFGVVLVGRLVVRFICGLFLLVRCHHVEDGHLRLWFGLGWLVFGRKGSGLGHGYLVFRPVLVAERAFDTVFLEVMHRPAIYGIIVDTGGLSAFLGLFLCLVAGKFQKAGKRLFVQERFAVFYDLHAFVDLVRKNFGGVLLQVGFDLLFFRRLCFKI